MGFPFCVTLFVFVLYQEFSFVENMNYSRTGEFHSIQGCGMHEDNENVTHEYKLDNLEVSRTTVQASLLECGEMCTAEYNCQGFYFDKSNQQGTCQLLTSEPQTMNQHFYCNMSAATLPWEQIIFIKENSTVSFNQLLKSTELS